MKHKTNSDFNKCLPKEVKAKYQIVGLKNRTSFCLHFPKYGTVNFKKISLKSADQLYKIGFPHFKLKEDKPEIEKKERDS